MNIKLLAATAVASLSLATAAFAGEARNDTFAFQPPHSVTLNSMPRDVGSEAYPAPVPELSTAALTQPTLPANGGDAGVESLNSRPLDWAVGTPQYVQAQALERWRAEQAQDGYASAPALTHTHG